jgi:hypothetical protein
MLGNMTDGLLSHLQQPSGENLFSVWRCGATQLLPLSAGPAGTSPLQAAGLNPTGSVVSSADRRVLGAT